MEKIYSRLAAGDINGALAILEALPPEQAEKSETLLIKASILYSAGRFDAGRTAAQSALKASMNTKDTIEAQFVLSNIAAAQGNAKEQKELLDTIIKTNPVFVPALNTLGQLSLNDHKLKTAAGYYDSALKAAPKDFDALTGRAAVYRLERKPKEAERCLNEALASYPNNAEIYAQRGRLFREANRLAEALADLNKAKSIDSTNYWIAYDLGRTLLAMDEKRRALLEFERAEKIDPNIFVSYVYSAGIRDDMSDHKNAMRDYEQVVKLKPDYYFGFEMLGIHYMREKRWKAAKEAFSSAYAKAPEEYRYALLAVINSFYAGEKQAHLKPYIEEIMRKIDRSNPEYYMLRLFYDFSGDADVARRTGSEKNPELKAKGLFYLASYYGVRGNDTLAQKFYDDFKQLQRKDMLEWRIYEWVIEDSAYSAAAAKSSQGSS